MFPWNKNKKRIELLEQQLKVFSKLKFRKRTIDKLCKRVTSEVEVELKKLVINELLKIREHMESKPKPLSKFDTDKKRAEYLS